MNKNTEWMDPLYFDSFLSEEEKKIRENTKKFCKKILLPIVVSDNRNHYFDKNIYKEFGKMGFLGSTIKGYGSAEINKVSYGLIASEIEQKIIPNSLSCLRYVVAIETESKTTSTAIPERTFCSCRGIPSFSYVFKISGSISSKDLGLSLILFGEE